MILVSLQGGKNYGMTMLIFSLGWDHCWQGLEWLHKAMMSYNQPVFLVTEKLFIIFTKTDQIKQI